MRQIQRITVTTEPEEAEMFQFSVPTMDQAPKTVQLQRKSRFLVSYANRLYTETKVMKRVKVKTQNKIVLNLGNKSEIKLFVLFRTV